ncbi:MAG: M1 family metallopeptidase [Bacteroidia bacterium]
MKVGYLWLFLLVAAQKEYFQQRVEYAIRVYLIDSLHMLAGFCQITYHNQSPDTLREMYIHLWPNAYRNRRTALARQFRAQNKTRFHFASKGERGWIDSLRFEVDGVPVSYSFWKGYVDVAYLRLPRPLPPGQKVVFSTPFVVKLPGDFSRLGHAGNQYQISQWYPKPAVYDRRGWHPMPYLDQGEFYSEYGRFDVEIHVPEGYVVLATGELKKESKVPWARSWLIERAQQSRKALETTPIDTSFFVWGKSYKVFRYVAEDVHDFAWFADRRYLVLRDSVQLPRSKRWVHVWAAFPPQQALLWRNAPQYVKEAIFLYSYWVGDYVYPQVTAVSGALKAGGGMEYPMITVIGPQVADTQTLRRVIIHEVGHNWFYGILGSHERRFPWMDEGVNSYYEQRCVDSLSLPFTSLGRDSQAKQSPYGGGTLTISARLVPLLSFNWQQALNLPAPAYASVNYGLGIYLQTASYLQVWAEMVGQSAFDRAMQTYYQDWKLKHPYPDDMRRSWEKASIPTQGFFDGFIARQKPLDFSLQAQKVGNHLYRIQIKEKAGYGLSRAPLYAWRKGYKFYELLGYVPMDTVLKVDSSVRYLSVNASGKLPERFLQNNSYAIGCIFPTWRTQRIRVGIPWGEIHQRVISFLPLIGYNHRDGLWVGLIRYTGVYPKSRWEGHLLPAYSFLKNDWRGSAGLTVYSYFEGSPLERIAWVVRGAYFADLLRGSVQARLFWRRPYESPSWRHTTFVRGHYTAVGNPKEIRTFYGEKLTPWAGWSYVGIDQYAYRSDPIFPHSVELSVGSSLRGVWQAQGAFTFRWQALRRRFLELRLYGGWVSAQAPAYMQLYVAGYDPLGQVVMWDRWRESKARVMQFIPNQGGLPVPVWDASGRQVYSVLLRLPLLSFVGLEGGIAWASQKPTSYAGIVVHVPSREKLLALHVPFFSNARLPYWVGLSYRLPWAVEIWDKYTALP